MSFSRGFTLSEVLVSLVVVSVGLLALSTLALYGFNEFQYNKTRLEAQAEMMKFEYLVTAYFGQAVKVQGADPQLNGTLGGIRSFDYSTIAAAPAPLTLIASFHRDTGGRGNNIAQVIGNYRQSAIWWRRPSATTSGVVFFVEGAPGTNITPSYGAQYVGRLTELQFQRELGGQGNNRLAAINIRAVFRYYRPSTGRIWCPQADIIGGTTGCAGSAMVYSDLEKSFRVGLRNNILHDTSLMGGPLPERPLGLVYFFNPVIPLSWRL